MLIGNVRKLTHVYEQAVVKGKWAECGNSKRLSGIVPRRGPATEIIAKAGLIRYRGVYGPSPSIEVRFSWPASLTRFRSRPSLNHAWAADMVELVPTSVPGSGSTDSRQISPVLSIASITLDR